MRIRLATIMCLIGCSAFGVTTYVPEAAVEIASRSREGAIELPSGAFTNAIQPVEYLEGKVSTQSWRIDDVPSVEAIVGAMSGAYARQGFKPNFQCQSTGCGGFAFRYALELTPPPNFQVNLDNYSYVDLRTEDEIVTILASHVNGSVYINQLHVQIATKDEVVLKEGGQSVPPAAQSDSRWVLASVAFTSGSSQIAAKDDAELQKVADRLRGSDENVFIVGHSDQTGGLDVNMSISSARAAQVRKILIDEFRVDPNRITSKGVAFLAPIADNNTEEGRAANRRVEAVFLVN